MKRKELGWEKSKTGTFNSIQLPLSIIARTTNKIYQMVLRGIRLKQIRKIYSQMKIIHLENPIYGFSS